MANGEWSMMNKDSFSAEKKNNFIRLTGWPKIAEWNGQNFLRAFLIVKELAASFFFYVQCSRLQWPTVAREMVICISGIKKSIFLLPGSTSIFRLSSGSMMV